MQATNRQGFCCSCIILFFGKGRLQLMDVMAKKKQVWQILAELYLNHPASVDTHIKPYE
jgi:hypothetical protein